MCLIGFCIYKLQGRAKAPLQCSVLINFLQLCFALTTHSNIITYNAAVLRSRCVVHDNNAVPEDIKDKL